MNVIETQRLKLQPYVPADADAMAALHARPEVMAFMKDSRTLSRAEADETFARYLHCWKTDGFGIFAVRRLDDDAFIGECGHWHRTDKPGVSMRFLLHPEYWGEGYGWEMNDAATGWLFTEAGVPSFWAVTQSRNKGAVAILRRLGGRVTETAHTGQPGLWRFDVDRPAWADARARFQD